MLFSLRLSLCLSLDQKLLLSDDRRFITITAIFCPKFFCPFSLLLIRSELTFASICICSGYKRGAILLSSGRLRPQQWLIHSICSRVYHFACNVEISATVSIAIGCHCIIIRLLIFHRRVEIFPHDNRNPDNSHAGQDATYDEKN